jgi:hypothetical protein
MGSAGTPQHQLLLLLLGMHMTQQTPVAAQTYQQIQQQQQQQEEEAGQQVAWVLVVEATAACSWNPCPGWKGPLLGRYKASCTAPTVKRGWGLSTGQVSQAQLRFVVHACRRIPEMR